MKIEVFASGSAGNAYRVTLGSTALLLECGIPFRQLQRRSGYTLAKAAGCLLTHEHGDHAKAVRELLAFGVPVWCSPGTARALDIQQTAGVRPAIPLEPFFLGQLQITPLAVRHDAAQPLGWVVDGGGERLVFLTDTAPVGYTFPGVTHLMIECNHLGPAAMGSTNAILARRVLDNHLSLDQCLELLRRQDPARLQEIWLLHISRSHGDPAAMKQAVAAALGRPVWIAEQMIQEEPICRTR